MSTRDPRFGRADESLPPVGLEIEYLDPEVRDVPCSEGRFGRADESLPPVGLEIEYLDPEVAGPVLVLTVGAPAAPLGLAEGVADVVLRLAALGEDIPGRARLRRVPPPHAPDPGKVTLAFAPVGPADPAAVARLQQLARAISSPTVEAKVVPAA